MKYRQRDPIRVQYLGFAMEIPATHRIGARIALTHRTEGPFGDCVRKSWVMHAKALIFPKPLRSESSVFGHGKALFCRFSILDYSEFSSYRYSMECTWCFFDFLRGFASKCLQYIFMVTRGSSS